MNNNKSFWLWRGKQVSWCNLEEKISEIAEVDLSVIITDEWKKNNWNQYLQ
jgi:hypothetical protein